MKSVVFLAVIFSLAVTVNAYCPNLCSGHGTCGAGDVCTCYKYQGTTRGDYESQSLNAASIREAWTGADCSLRTCPLAYSWSSSEGFESRLTLQSDTTTTDVTSVAVATVADGTIYTVGTKVYFDDANGNTATRTVLATAATTLTVDSNVGIDCNANTCTIYSKYNDAARKTSANGVHALLECGGQGICDRQTGECDCFPGYEGEGCARSSCPNSCSGHGVCLSAERLQDDYSNTYSEPWDAKKHFGCKCDIGFRGPDCSSQECPSTADPLLGCGGGPCNDATGNDLDGTACSGSIACTGAEQRDCSGRGLCDYDTGVCKCFAGFYGEACQSQTILI